MSECDELSQQDAHIQWLRFRQTLDGALRPSRHARARLVHLDRHALHALGACDPWPDKFEHDYPAGLEWPPDRARWIDFIARGYGPKLAWLYLVTRNLSDRPDLAFADLAEQDLCEAGFHGADLSFAMLAGADLRRALASLACWHGAHLEEADLSGARLCYANFIGANLRGANLSAADLTGAALQGADLTGANLAGAVMPYAVPTDPRERARAYLRMVRERYGAAIVAELG